MEGRAAIFPTRSNCWKFLGGRLAPTQSCLKSCSQRNEHFLETFCFKNIGCSQFGFVKPSCVQTIQQVRKYASFKNSDLPCLWENLRGSKHGTMFQIPPLQRQGVYSFQAQCWHCHTRNVQIKQRLLRHHIIFIGLFHACPRPRHSGSSMLHPTPGQRPHPSHILRNRRPPTLYGGAWSLFRLRSRHTRMLGFLGRYLTSFGTASATTHTRLPPTTPTTVIHNHQPPLSHSTCATPGTTRMATTHLERNCGRRTAPNKPPQPP